MTLIKCYFLIILQIVHILHLNVSFGVYFMTFNNKIIEIIKENIGITTEKAPFLVFHFYLSLILG